MATKKTTKRIRPPRIKNPPRLDPKRAGELRESVADAITIKIRDGAAPEKFRDMLERLAVPIPTAGGEAAHERIRERERDLELATPAGKSVPRLILIAKGLEELHQRMHRMIDRLESFNADRLGAIPQSPPSQASNAPTPSGITGELGRLVESLHSAANTLEAEISRAHEL
jgi:hypothetical protein